MSQDERKVEETEGEEKQQKEQLKNEDTQEAEEEEEDEEVEEEEEEVDPRTLLTKEQVEFFKKIFDQFDPEQKERVPTKTVAFALRFMGLNPTKAEIKKHIDEIDPQHKGVVDFQSFLLPMAQKVNDEQQSHEDIIEAFKVFDEEGQNYVHTDQLIEFLTTLAEELEDFEIESLIKMADPKGIGKIYYVDFVEKLFGIVRKTGKKDKNEKKGKKK